MCYVMHKINRPLNLIGFYSEEQIKEKIAEYEDKFASPYQAAERGYIDDVILPHDTRFRIIRAFEMLKTKRLTNPMKKHSNIPL